MQGVMRRNKKIFVFLLDLKGGFLCFRRVVDTRINSHFKIGFYVVLDTVEVAFHDV